MDLISQATHKSGQNQQLGLACVTQLGRHILRSYRNTTYKKDNDDEESMQSIDTLPYDLDVCQLIDSRKGNWRKTILAKLGGSAH